MGLLTTGRVKGKRIVVNIITRHMLIRDRFSIFHMFIKHTLIQVINYQKKLNKFGPL